MDIVIIEDEALAAERLKELILEVKPDIKVLAILESVRDSVQWLRSNHPDLIFLDIRLSDGNSFEIFDQITVHAPIIFTTAYDQYAIKAFKHNSIDYLLKPIRKEELAASLQKYRELKAAFRPDLSGLLEALHSSSREYKKRYLIHYGDTLRKVETKDIAYFYAQDKYVFLTTFSEQTYPMDTSLNQLEEEIDPEIFFRINRQMIINQGAIKQMHAWSRSRIKIDLVPKEPKGMKALVSVNRTPEFKAWLDR